MNTQDNNFDRIDTYLFGQMSTEDAAAFEQELSGNAELAKAVELQRMEHRAMHLLLKKDLQANLNEWKQEELSTGTETEQTVKVIPMRRRFFQFAAAACVVALLGWMLNYLLNQADYPAMAARYFEESSASVRGGDLPASQGLGVALEKMREHDYKSALTYIQEEKDSTYSEIALFLKGECYFRLKEYRLASAVFKEIVSSTTSNASRQKAEWYLLLTYLAAGGKNDPSFQALHREILSNPSHAFNREAVSIQENL